MFYKNNSKKIINTKFSLVVCLLFLLYFFSNNLIYATSLTKTKNDFLIPVGNVLHIEAQLENVIVRSNIKDSPFTLGDEIISINNNTIKSYSDFSNVLNSLPDSANVIDVTLKRNNHITNIKTLKSKLEEMNSYIKVPLHKLLRSCISSAALPQNPGPAQKAQDWGFISYPFIFSCRGC